MRLRRILGNPWEGVECTTQEEYARAIEKKAEREARARMDAGVPPEKKGGDP